MFRPGDHMRPAFWLWLIFAVSCTPKSEDSGHGDHAHEHDNGGLPDDFDPSTEVQTNQGSYTVSYTTDPSPIPESTLFSVTYTVSEGTLIGADATMPTHGGHGMTVEPTITLNEDGSYTAMPFEFHMPGYWVIHGTIQGEDGTMERADFDVECCD